MLIYYIIYLKNIFSHYFYSSSKLIAFASRQNKHQVQWRRNIAAIFMKSKDFTNKKKFGICSYKDIA